MKIIDEAGELTEEGKEAAAEIGKALADYTLGLLDDLQKFYSNFYDRLTIEQRIRKAHEASRK